jgi:hypothetical protein
MGIDIDSICIYGISFEYDDIKNMQSFPEEWIYEEYNDAKLYDILQFRSSSPWFDCDDTCKIYHVGTPERLLIFKDTLVEQLKSFCKDNNLKYNEPRISSHPNVW